jgi:hypothetical protein
VDASFGSGLEGYANEIVRMGDLRKVVDLMAKRSVDDQLLRAMAFENYMRYLKTAFNGRRA